MKNANTSKNSNSKNSLLERGGGKIRCGDSGNSEKLAGKTSSETTCTRKAKAYIKAISLPAASFKVLLQSISHIAAGGTIQPCWSMT